MYQFNLLQFHNWCHINTPHVKQGIQSTCSKRSFNLCFWTILSHRYVNQIMRTYELRTYPSIAKKNVAWNSINGYLPAQGCRKRGGRGTRPPPQISKPYLNQGGQIMPTKLLFPPPLPIFKPSAIPVTYNVMAKTWQFQSW